MKKLELSKSRSGETFTAIVDNNFYEIASQYRWYCNIIADTPYACRNEKLSVWKYAKVLLHRSAYEFAFGKLPKHTRITFVNGNTLDCRANNLRIVGKPKIDAKKPVSINKLKMVSR